MQNIKHNDSLELNEAFNHAIDLMENSGKSLFITGKAGTGKSTLLHYFCENTSKKPVILAPTGVAALNVGGQTIHRFFNFGIDVTAQKVRDKKSKPRDAKLYKNLKTIIIDEVSMLRADILDCIDEFLQLYGPLPHQRFGGVQMIFVGDLYQLPPVVGREEKEVFENYYKTPYFFSAFSMQGYGFEIIELEKIYRQKNSDFVAILNRIRNNSVQDIDIEVLNSRLHSPASSEFQINLTTTNKAADEVNEKRLRELSGKLQVARAKISGNFTKEYYPTADELAFKIGAQVMLLNNDSKQRWVNGTMGVIEGLKKNMEGEEYMKIRLSEDDKIVHVTPHTWEVVKFTSDGANIDSEQAGTFIQYPLRLAWAVTIHKSQGKTFQNVTIDVGTGAFASGQMYVAFSRCTSFEGISLANRLKKTDIRTDPRIYEFLTDYHYTKAESAQPRVDKISIIENAIAGKNELAMTYLQANDTKSERRIRPSRVQQESYQGTKYMGMKAFCMELQVEKMFSVERILKIAKV